MAKLRKCLRQTIACIRRIAGRWALPIITLFLLVGGSFLYFTRGAGKLPVATYPTIEIFSNAPVSLNVAVRASATYIPGQPTNGSSGLSVTVSPLRGPRRPVALLIGIVTNAVRSYGHKTDAAWTADRDPATGLTVYWAQVHIVTAVGVSTQIQFTTDPMISTAPAWVYVSGPVLPSISSPTLAVQPIPLAAGTPTPSVQGLMSSTPTAPSHMTRSPEDVPLHPQPSASSETPIPSASGPPEPSTLVLPPIAMQALFAYTAGINSTQTVVSIRNFANAPLVSEVQAPPPVSGLPGQWSWSDAVSPTLLFEDPGGNLTVQRAQWLSALLLGIGGGALVALLQTLRK